MADKCAVILLSGGTTRPPPRRWQESKASSCTRSASLRPAPRARLAFGAEDRKFSARAIAQRNCLRSSRDRWFRADRPNRSSQATQRIRNLPRHSHHLRAGAQHDLSGICIGARRAIEAQDIFRRQSTSTIAVTLTVARNIFRPLNEWRISRPRPASKAKSRIRIRTPLLKMTKAEIIRAGLKLGLDYGLTWSCYDPLADGRACRRCDSCQLRLKGFEEAGAVDPIPYAE